MKKENLIFFVFVIFSKFVESQNTFPASGNAGIGTLAPSAPLHIYSASNPKFRLESVAGANYTWDLRLSGESLLFDYNSSTKVTFKKNGNVGIGVSNPTYRLSVDNVISGTSFYDYNNATYYIDPSETNIGLRMAGSINADGGGFFSNYSNLIGGSYVGDGLVGIAYPIPDNGLLIQNSNNARITLFSKSGIKAPIFDIYNNASTESLNFAKMVTPGVSPTVLMKLESDGVTVTDLFVSNTSTFEGISVFNDKVGINTSNPEAELSVNGLICAKEIRVQTSGSTPCWPDYVFNENYSLMSLSELKSFIVINNHLPETPTESAIEESGINLAEMNILLLQKVEELTLYVIQLSEEINELKK